MTTEVDLVDYCSNDYHERRHPELLENPELLQAWAYFADLAYFQHVEPGQSVLEFGGGLGNNLLTVRKRAMTWMVEPSAIGRETAQQSGIRVAASLAELNGQRFDTVLCRHVLEHTDHPLSTLHALRERILAGGRLVVVVPCENVNLAATEDDLDHHLYCWNPRTLTNLLKRAGYQILRVRHETFGAKRKMMLIYHWMGGKAYAHAVRIVGRMFHFRELVVEARPYENESID